MELGGQFSLSSPFPKFCIMNMLNFYICRKQILSFLKKQLYEIMDLDN